MVTDKLSTVSYTPGYILTCATCHSIYRAECVNRLITELPSYCPYCGASSVNRGMDSDKDYWYSLAQSFGLPYTKEGAQNIRDLYDLWPHEEFTRFSDFVAWAFNNNGDGTV